MKKTSATNKHHFMKIDFTMNKQQFILTFFLIFIAFSMFSQEVLRRDTIGKFEIIVEKNGYGVNILSVYEGRIDTVWDNLKGIVPVHRIQNINVYDDNKFVLIYLMHETYIYCIKIWNGIKWENGYSSVIASLSMRSSPIIKLLDYNLLEVKQKNSIIRILYDIENKKEIREVIKN